MIVEHVGNSGDPLGDVNVVITPDGGMLVEEYGSASDDVVEVRDRSIGIVPFSLQRAVLYDFTEYPTDEQWVQIANEGALLTAAERAELGLEQAPVPFQPQPRASGAVRLPNGAVPENGGPPPNFGRIASGNAFSSQDLRSTIGGACAVDGSLGRGLAALSQAVNGSPSQDNLGGSGEFVFPQEEFK